MSAGQMLFVVVLLLVAGGGLYRDAWRHPRANCRKCKGSGKHFSWVSRILSWLPWVQTRHGVCRRCKGSGTRRPFLPWLFRIDPDAHKRRINR